MFNSAPRSKLAPLLLLEIRADACLVSDFFFVREY